MVRELAGCVILDDSNKILLLHRNSESVVQWELPGGKIEIGETPQAAAQREIKEELGVDVKIVRLLGSAAFIDNDNTFNYTWFLAEVETGRPAVCEPEMFDELQSFDIGELEKLKLSANMENLHRALNGDLISLD